jgi:antitoxin MazE
MKRQAVIVTEIISIGNSKGLRIPKAIREQVGLEGKVTLAVKDNALVVRPKREPREGWDAAFKRSASRDDPLLLPDDVQNQFDEKEWTW